MTKLLEQVEEMRERLTEISKSEQALVRALADALSRVDERLLTDVRRVTSDHEARRGAILDELQTLASRICAFPMLVGPQPPAPGHSIPAYPPAANGEQTFSPGDWRRAASNVDGEIELHLMNGHRTAN